MDGKIALLGPTRFARSTRGALRLLIAAALAVALLLAGRSGAPGRSWRCSSRPPLISRRSAVATAGSRPTVSASSRAAAAIQAEVGGGATVVQAYLYGTYSGTSAFDPRPTRPSTSTAPTWCLTGLPDVSPGCCALNAARATVTAQVAAKVGTRRRDHGLRDRQRPAGASRAWGCVVIYSDPGCGEDTIAVLDGGAGPGRRHGDVPVRQPAGHDGARFRRDDGARKRPRPRAPSGHVCGGGQFSTVDVNAQRAGQLRGELRRRGRPNGGLITVGGVGDSMDNPADPNSSNTGEGRRALQPRPAAAPGRHRS